MSIAMEMGVVAYMGRSRGGEDDDEDEEDEEDDAADADAACSR